MNASRLQKLIQDINRFGASAGGGINRLAYTDEYWKAVDYFIGQCKAEGLSVRIDEIGNVIARREGQQSDMPAVACGSHLDTVYEGGRYDGTIGVAAALEMIRILNEQSVATKHPIEIIAFAGEESSRFGVSTIGSKAMAGKLDSQLMSRLTDKSGVTFAEALQAGGLSIRNIAKARRERGSLKAFFELHIEQGPVLEQHALDIGIVHAIAAPTRLEVKVQGKASHSGTTPMSMRKDALIGAAEIVTGVEKAALSETANGTVATVGSFDVYPGAMNIIPDHVGLKIDVRGTSLESKRVVLDAIYALFRKVESERGLAVEWRMISEEEPVELDREIVAELRHICETEGISHMTMMSGAGHDAMNMMELCPTGLIFIPSHDGLSHHRDEFSTIKQIVTGARLLKEAVLVYAEAHPRPSAANIS